MIDAVEAAWAAGLFEGEGSIEVSERGGVRLRLNMTDQDVVEKFAVLAECGKVRRITAPSMAKPNWKPQWGWSASQAAECQRLLRLWLPHLGTRRAARSHEALSLLAEKEAALYRTCYCGKPYKAAHGWQQHCGVVCQQAWSEALRDERAKVA